MPGKCGRPNIGEGQHGYLPIGEIGVATTVEALRLFAEAGACGVPYDKASLGQFGDDKVSFVVQVGRDAVSGQVIGPGELYLGIFRSAANPDGSAIAPAAAGIPDADVITLADVVTWSLEGQIFLTTIKVEITYRRGRVCTAKDRVYADARRGDEVDLVGTIPASRGKSGTDLPIGAAYLHVDGITRIAVAIEGCQRRTVGRDASGNSATTMRCAPQLAPG